MESTFSLWSERTYNWGPKQNGYIFAFAGLCGVIVQGFLISKLVKRFGESFLCRLGCANFFRMISVAFHICSSCLFIYGTNCIWFRFVHAYNIYLAVTLFQHRRGWVLRSNPIKLFSCIK